LRPPTSFGYSDMCVSAMLGTEQVRTITKALSTLATVAEFCDYSRQCGQGFIVRHVVDTNGQSEKSERVRVQRYADAL